jgi:hypothetical protein
LIFDPKDWLRCFDGLVLMPFGDRLHRADLDLNLIEVDPYSVAGFDSTDKAIVGGAVVERVILWVGLGVLGAVDRAGLVDAEAKASGVGKGRDLGADATRVFERLVKKVVTIAVGVARVREAQSASSFGAWAVQRQR